MKSFDLPDLLHSSCPNLWHDLIGAGKVVNGRLEVPDEIAERILTGCQSGDRLSALRGLGDVVALITQPIARAIDAVAGTKLKTCAGCQSRQARLNDLVPFRH